MGLQISGLFMYPSRPDYPALVSPDEGRTGGLILARQAGHFQYRVPRFIIHFPPVNTASCIPAAHQRSFSPLAS